jgi:hypothetical protein
MKNVAKCDTWCELQNPANHQFFERKLRPKPFGRGHACLGVVNPLALGTRTSIGGDMPGRGMWSPVGLACIACRPAVGRKSSTRATGSAAFGGSNVIGCVVGPACGGLEDYRISQLRSQVRRGYPLSLSISISGGEETNQDSLSSGERTGRSPA